MDNIVEMSNLDEWALWEVEGMAYMMLFTFAQWYDMHVSKFWNILDEQNRERLHNCILLLLHLILDEVLFDFFYGIPNDI